MVHHFRAEQWVPVPLEPVFRFFANPGNLPRIMPPWMHVELLRLKVLPPPGLPPVTATVTDAQPFAGAGSEVEASYRAVPFLPLRVTSVALITQFAMNSYFEDIQARGPFKSWHHRHEFAAEARDGVSGTLIRDIVTYDVGFGILGTLVNMTFVAPQMRRTFAHRQKALEKLLRASRSPLSRAC